MKMLLAAGIDGPTYAAHGKRFPIRKNALLAIVFAAVSLGATPVRSQEKVALPELSESEKVFQAELKKSNPEYDGKATVTLGGNASIIEVSFKGSKGVVDISPLKGLPLEKLSLKGASVADLSPLKGVKLKSINLSGNKDLSDITLLSGMPLESFNCVGTSVSSLSALKDSPLTSVDIGNKVVDISALRGKQIQMVEIEGWSHTKPEVVRGLFGERGLDLSPLENAPIKRFNTYEARQIKDISALKNARLEWLRLERSLVEDISPLKGQPIKNAIINAPVNDVSPLAGSPVVYLDVCSQKGLVDMSAFMDCPAAATMEDLRIDDTGITDISFIKNMKKLIVLTTGGCQIKDLSPIKDMDIQVFTFSPKNYSPEQIKIVRETKSLKWISTGFNEGWGLGLGHDISKMKRPTLPAEEFWMNYDAGKYK